VVFMFGEVLLDFLSFTKTTLPMTGGGFQVVL